MLLWCGFAGAPIEAILKTGPRMLWWNEEPISSVETAALYKLVDGQDKTFANAMLQRLADSFRTGNNFIRLCIVKAFLLVSKSSGRRGRGGTGLFKKERIANHQEVLKRVKTVMDSGDVVARALALRMLGCLGEIAADSVDVHRLVIEALESPHYKEVDAALFATGCLCELSSNYAQVAFEKVVDMANAMGSSPATKLAAIRVFSKFGVSPHLSLAAHEEGESLLLRLPTTDIVSAMLTTLTALALKSTVTSERQVELLFAYVSSDPRATVRAVALQCLSKLACQAVRIRVSNMWNFSVLLSVAEDSVAAPALRVLAFEVLHKLSDHFVRVVAKAELYRLLLTVESNFLSYAWPLRQAALECLGSFGCNLAMLKLPEGSGRPDAEEFTKVGFEREGQLYEGNATSMQESNWYQSHRSFAARVGLLLCDQLALEGALAMGVRNKVTGEELREVEKGFDPDRLLFITGLVARLMQNCPEIAPMISDSLFLLIKAVTQKYVEGVRSLMGKKEAAAPMDLDSKESTEPEVALEGNEVVSTRLETELEFVLTLCHCVYVGASGMDLTSASSTLLKLLDLTTQVSGDNSACHILRATLPALLRVWSLSGRRSNDRISIEGLITKCIDQLREIGEVWPAYKVASEAAAYGFWLPACALFEALVKKVHSEGCYLWLLGLSHVAKAEAILRSSDNKKEHSRISGREVPASTAGDEEIPSTSTSGMEMDVETGYIDTTVLEQLDQGNNLAFTYGKAAARAIPLLRQVGSILAAGVCSERTFEFQRWLISIRLRIVQSVADLLQILRLVLSSYSLPEATTPAVDMNMDCSIPAFGSPGGEASVNTVSDGVYDRQILSTFRSAKERASGICTQLIQLSKELDLLGLSFLGLDEESLERLREASVSCSLLAFCTDAVFLVVLPSSENLKDDSAVRNLYLRLRHVNGLQGIDLLQSWVEAKNETDGSLMGGCCPNSAVVRVCDWAIKIISKLERGTSVLKQQNSFQDVRVEALHFLQLLIGECSQLPCPIPRYFFCTSPRAAVELFVAQTGREELSELCVKQGSSLVLSICAQLTNEPVRNSSKISSLFCVLTFQGVESTSLVEEDLYADWKLGWHEGQASNQSLVDFSLVEKLVQRAKCVDAKDAVELEEGLVSLSTAKDDTCSSMSGKGSAKRAGASGRSFAIFTMDKKGKGFSSCNLDVSAFPSGQYQLSFDCVGMDAKNKPWVLLPSRILPSETLKISPSGASA
ncbi:hypothetical protein KC19_8G155500 [Ceratodon purpureus]|uniref:Uncharacterized protein n=1 Tax=Ceratodon purpureus TaxID=3225 RepID=A0A8T0GYW2_CERPU|nr:hypothetical protein KC19_8G155500 [Ceratodon purpureus]